MGANRYVALLRGINVGGRNQIPMEDLRHTFVAAGYGEVATYIQSGNVLFSSDAARASLEGVIERLLERRYGHQLVVVVRSRQQLRNVVAKAPRGFGGEPKRYHSDVVYLKAPLTVARAMRAVELRDDVDEMWPGTSSIYFARRSDRLGQSRLSRITSKPEYQLMTIRNWRTTTKLVDLLDGP